MDNIKVSVVVPVYNTSKYLRECLDSIIGQTLKDIEIICVNDGSTDNSLEMLQEYAENDSRIKIISKENRGYGHTMNVGFDAATGEYIGIVESDDYVQLDMMEKLYNVAKAKDVDFVKSDYYLFWGNGENRVTEKVSLVSVEDIYEQQLGKEQIKSMCRGYIANCTGIYKRSFINNHMIRHNETPGASYQDLGFLFQIIMYASSGYLLRDNFYMYRQDNENSSINNRAKIFCNCDEYSFIENKLKSDQELMHEYNAIFQFYKFAGYQYTFSRIADEFRMDFIDRINQEWSFAEKNGELDLSFFNDQEKSEFELLYTRPNEYYYKKTKLSKNFNDVLSEYDSVIIYGAGYKGAEVYNALKVANKKYDFICFAVSEKQEGNDIKQGVPIESIHKLAREHKNAAVIIAVTERYEGEMIKNAKSLGFANIVTLREVEGYDKCDKSISNHTSV